MRDLDYFFKARSVAVIGASTRPGKVGHEILRSLVEGEYKGRVYPVNPRAEEILGVKAYPSVLDIPDTVDLAVIVTPSKVAPRVVEECGRKGVKAIVIVSGGFKEVGREGAEIERRVVEIARSYGMRVIGPNCIGIFDSRTRLDTFFQSRERMVRPPPGPIAFLTQSGTFGCTLLEWAAEDGIGISKFVSYGNRSDVDEADLIEYLGEDPETKVIAIYTESVSDGRKLLKAARNVLPKKPIVILKAGRTEEGSRAALSHTGWLAGSYKVFSAAMRQVGVIEASDMEELYGISKALSMQPSACGPNVAMVTNGAGPCVMAADEISITPLKLAEYSEKTYEGLKRELPPYAQIGNPVDLTGSATSTDYEVALRHLGRDPNVDIIMPFFVFQDTPLDEGIIRVVSDAKRYGKPIVAVAAGGPYTRRQSRRLEREGIPVFQSPRLAVRAALALYLYGSRFICRGKKVNNN